MAQQIAFQKERFCENLNPGLQDPQFIDPGLSQSRIGVIRDWTLILIQLSEYHPKFHVTIKAGQLRIVSIRKNDISCHIYPCLMSLTEAS